MGLACSYLGPNFRAYAILRLNNIQVSAPRFHAKMTPISGFNWQSYIDETPTADDDRAFSGSGLYEQLNVTRDNSDYLWYMTEYVILPFYCLDAFPTSMN